MITRRKVSDIRAFDMTKVEETIKRGGSLRETKTKLGTGRNCMHALKDENGDVTNIMDEIVRIAENVYAQLYDSNARPKNIPYRTELMSGDVPVIIIGEIKKALKVMGRGKAAGEDGTTGPVEGWRRYIVLEKLANLYTKFLRTLT